jgi:hypothetical protein
MQNAKTEKSKQCKKVKVKQVHHFFYDNGMSESMTCYAWAVAAVVLVLIVGAFTFPHPWWPQGGAVLHTEGECMIVHRHPR